MRLKKEDAILVIIDFQEKLMPAIKDNEEISRSVEILIKGCRIMGVPIIVTQQYTKGLGDTIPSIKEAIGDQTAIEKTSFSCCGETVFSERLIEIQQKSVIIAGVEAHICVQQTVLDLLEKGYKVFIAADCIGSRKEIDKEIALRRMENSGAVVTTGEAVLFELCGGAKTEGFKEISKLVK
ncbi:MAG: hydrolase [Clostridiaceae bacterium]|nr:hydrolase [Clostridiaceae bacterium]